MRPIEVIRLLTEKNKNLEIELKEKNIQIDKLTNKLINLSNKISDSVIIDDDINEMNKLADEINMLSEIIKQKDKELSEINVLNEIIKQKDEEINSLKNEINELNQKKRTRKK